MQFKYFSNKAISSLKIQIIIKKCPKNRINGRFTDWITNKATGKFE